MSDDTGPWTHSFVLCLNCHHRWMAVFPLGTCEMFECSACGEMQGVRDDEG